MNRSIQEFGVRPGNAAAENAAALQKVIDWASPRGGALFVEPVDEPYAVDSGVVLRRNVSLVGVHGPVGRGTCHPDKPQPVGSVFAIEHCYGYPLSGTFIRFNLDCVAVGIHNLGNKERP